MPDDNVPPHNPKPAATPPPSEVYAAPPNYAQPPSHYPAPGQPGQPPQGYGPPLVYKNPAEAKNWMNITSLVLSLSGMLFGMTAIAGIVFGHLGMSAAKRGEATNRSLGLAGVIIGYVLTGLFLLGITAYIVFIVVVVSECGGDNPASWC